MKAIAKIVFCFFFLSFAAGKGYGQNNRVDSLKKAVAANFHNDDRKATDLFNLSAALINSDPKKSLTYLDQVLTFEKNIKNRNIVSGTYRVKGIILNLLSNYPDALAALDIAYKMDKAQDNKFGEAGDLANMATIYLYQSNYPQSLNHYQQAAKILESLKGQEREATSVYANIGIIYMKINDQTKALEHFQKALLLHKRLNNKIGEVAALGNMANVYNEQKSYEKAILYGNMAIKLSDSIGDKIGFARETGNLASYYSSAGKYELALQYGLKAIELNKILGKKQSMGYNLQNVAEVYRKSGKPEQAKLYGLAALKIGDDLKMPDIQRGTSEGLSRVYEEKSMPDSALFYFKRFSLFDDSISNDKKRQEITRMNIQYDFDKKEITYKQQQLLLGEQLKQQDLQLDLNRAQLQSNLRLRNLQQVQLENEKLLTKEKQRRLAISIKNEKLQASMVKELSQQQQLNRLELKQLWLYGILFIVLISAILLYFLNIYRIRQLRLKNTMQQQQAEQQAKELIYQKKLSESELKAIRAQMNPHFIFNVLNSIESYIVENDSKMASRLVQKFAGLSRLILENSTQSMVTADREWKALKLYTELEAMRFNNQFSYLFIADPLIDLSALMLPPMLVQPLIENSIHHGMRNSTADNNRINISLEQTEKEIFFTVEDNGIGIDEAEKIKTFSAVKSKSIGLSAIRERIEIFNVMNEGRSAAFEIRKKSRLEGTGTVAILTLPKVFSKN